MLLAALVLAAVPVPPPATSEQEARIRSTLQVAVDKQTPANRCALPAPRLTDFLAVVGASSAKTLSSVTFLGQGEITEVAEIVIAPGKSPVFLVLYSPESLLWRVSGETKRVRQAVIIGSGSGGIVGMPKAKAQFVTEGDCGLSTSIYRGRTWANDVQVLATFGRRADAIGGDHSLYRATVSDTGLNVDKSFPSYSGDLIVNEGVATVFPRPLGKVPSSLQSLLKRHYPGGVAMIDPADVVATATVERYQQLPAVAGAARLERDGALIAATAVDVERWKERALINGRVRADKIDNLDFYAAYRVTRPIVLPGGLCGAYSLTLFVPSADYVRGDACHSNIYVDDGSVLTSPAMMGGD